MSSTISSLLGTVVGFGIQLILKLWKDVMNWLGNLVISLANLFTNAAKGVEHAAAIFLHKPAQGFVGVMHKLYYKDEIGQYIEKTTERTIAQEEVPDWAMAKMKGSNPVNMTRDFEAELQMRI